MSHSSSSTDGQTSYIFQPINKSRNMISSLFNEQELFQYFTSAESEFRSKCYSHKSRWCLCSSHVRRQRVMLNCCMFNVIFLRNKNMQSFSIVSLSERKFIFYNLQVALTLKMTMQIEHCNGTVYTSWSCRCVPLFGALLHPKKQCFCVYGMFFDTQLVRITTSVLL